jgi:hypothetical protein
MTTGHLAFAVAAVWFLGGVACGVTLGLAW